MKSTFDDRYRELLGAVEARRKHLPIRLVTTAFGSLVISLLLDSAWIWGWAAVYALAQSAEGVLFRPSGLAKWRAPARWRMAAICYILFIQATIGAAVALPLWMADSRYGPAIAVYLLAGAGLNLIVISGGSRLAFLVSTTPYSACSLLVIFADPGLPNTLRPLALVVAAGLVFNCYFTWRMSARALQKEQAAAAQAEAATAAKSAFVAMVSHELRTPITAMLAGAAALEREAADPQGRANAALILEAGAMMRTLLDDLLDLAKLEAGRMTAEAIAYDQRALICQAVRFWSVEAGKKGLKLRLEGAARLPRWVEGDPTRLRQILNNLFSNAIKFTETGSVTLTLSTQDGQVRCQVRDTGPGLDDDQMARLFTPFDQSDASIARTHGGTGLGLAISRQLARLMGGDLVASGTPGSGASFLLSLPLRPAAAPAVEAEVEPAAAPPPARARLRILVVDDHAINRRALGLILSPLEAELVEAETGADALEALAGQPFDLVLMDLNMPGLDGREATRRLRARGGLNQSVPVVAVTASAAERELSDCLAAGMNGHVVKPIDAQQLYAVMEAVLAPAAADGQGAAAA
ncbi:MAG: response regulator [Caulobacteraceae bacterium]|nr:response regulator [Caulobacteraceae bacterium]